MKRRLLTWSRNAGGRSRPRSRASGTGRRRSPDQLVLFGRKRASGGGRKPRPGLGRVQHVPRPRVTRHDVVHVTMRVADWVVGSLRQGEVAAVLARVFRAGKQRPGFRVVQFSVQTEHLHFVVEAAGEKALATGMQGLAIRIAKNLNKLAGRHGRVFVDRYHARVVNTPRETRTVLVYVLQNARHHPKTGAPPPGTPWCDPLSSARWFTGWKALPNLPPPRPDEIPPVAPATNWLLLEGWTRLGLVDPCEGPAN